MVDLVRRLAAEGLGSGFLVAGVVGSGIMAERLTQDGALALLANTLPTAAILVVLITVLGPISGAHLNPAVSVVAVLRGLLSIPEAGLYVVAQIAGAPAALQIVHIGRAGDEREIDVVAAEDDLTVTVPRGQCIKRPRRLQRLGYQFAADTDVLGRVIDDGAGLLEQG